METLIMATAKKHEYGMMQTKEVLAVTKVLKRELENPVNKTIKQVTAKVEEMTGYSQECLMHLFLARHNSQPGEYMEAHFGARCQMKREFHLRQFNELKP